MKILSFGSLNFDHVYQVDHFVAPKETMAARDYQLTLGGKGFNQTVAMAKAGLKVYFAGLIGPDGQPFVDYLHSLGVNTKHLRRQDKGVTGHAIIEVSGGENRIIICGGSNQQITPCQIDDTLSHFEAGDWLVLQNEISEIPYLIYQAHKRGLKIFFNAAPINEAIKEYPLQLVDTICLNEVEGQQLTGTSTSTAHDILAALRELYPESSILLTMGSGGSYYSTSDCNIYVQAKKVKVVDSTAAGDTFSGYFLAGRAIGNNIKESMLLATKAAALTIQRAGAAAAIPTLEEVLTNG